MDGCTCICTCICRGDIISGRAWWIRYPPHYMYPMAGHRQSLKTITKRLFHEHNSNVDQVCQNLLCQKFPAVHQVWQSYLPCIKCAKSVPTVLQVWKKFPAMHQVCQSFLRSIIKYGNSFLPYTKCAKVSCCASSVKKVFRHESSVPEFPAVHHKIWQKFPAVHQVCH